jgi:putative endonuclease
MDDIISIIETPSRRVPALGERGEALAAKFLIKNGYRLVCSNFTIPVGRNSKSVQVTGEIDIIALDGGTLCFIEVKTRRSDEFTPVITSVDTRKQRQITRTAKVYRRIFGVGDMEYRYDVVTVLFPKYADPEINILKDFWNDGKFRKRTWKYDAWHDIL